MILYLRVADETDIETLRAACNPSPVTEALSAKAGLFSKLFSRTAAPKVMHQEVANPVQEFFFANPDSGNVIDFDRAWDALNMMLTEEPFGNEGPFAIMYYHGEEIGPDAGYGPARYIPSAKMFEFAQALRGLGDTDLMGRFDADGFETARLYSSYLFSEDGEGVEYIMQGVPELRRFADQCAETNVGALVAIY